MSLKGKQAPLKEAFAFLGSLTNEYPAKQDEERDSAGLRVCKTTARIREFTKQSAGLRVCKTKRGFVSLQNQAWVCEFAKRVFQIRA